MTDRGEERFARRVDRLISDLRAGRRLKVSSSDADVHAAILMAARLAGEQQPDGGMAPAFRRKMARMLEGKGRKQPLTRRAALVAGLSALGGIAAGAAGEKLAHSGQPANEPAGDEGTGSRRSVLEPAPVTARWIDTGIAFSDLRDGEPRRVSAGSIGVFVVKRGQKLLAMSAFCTHQPCELLWRPGSSTLNCPCHNQEFDLEGHHLASTYALPALPLARIRVRRGRVEVLGTA